VICFRLNEDISRFLCVLVACKFGERFVGQSASIEDSSAMFDAHELSSRLVIMGY